MRWQAIVAVMMAASVISSCEERQNPLTNVDQDQVVSWLNKRDPNVGDRMAICAEFWAKESGLAMPADSLSDCNQLATYLAAEMSSAGFGNVVAEDIYLPSIWAEYVSRKSFNGYDPKAAARTIR